ncbi:MAG: hypothetical protein WD740_07415 [Anaerolineales bacterium]
MKKIRSLALFTLLILAACSPVLPADGAIIPWDQAVELLRSGQVTMVVQLHSGDVSLTLDNGAVVHTVGPHLDAIFAEIQACGAPCADTVQAME